MKGVWPATLVSLRLKARRLAWITLNRLRARSEQRGGETEHLDAEHPRRCGLKGAKGKTFGSRALSLAVSFTFLECFFRFSAR